MILNFNTHGNEKQKLCARYWIDGETDSIIYGGSKGSAKSFTGCSLIFGDAFIYPKTHYFIARKTLKDLRKYTIPSVHEVFEIWGLNQKYYSFNGKDSYFKLYNESRVYLLDAKYLPSDPNYERFGSIQMTRGWIEEAGEFEKECRDNLKISIGRWNNEKYGLKGKLLETCNPSKNYLYGYYKLNKEGKLPKNIKFVQALPTDNKKLDKGYLENLRLTLKGASRQRLLLGNWEYDDDPAKLCKYDAILSLFHNDHVLDEDKHYITTDIAAYGSDKFMIFVWKGWKIIKILVFDKSGGEKIVDAIKKSQKEYNIPSFRIALDADGVGSILGGNTGFFKKAFSFIAQSAPLEPLDKTKRQPKENYQNLDTQCQFMLAKKINDGGIWIDCELDETQKEHIIEELDTLKRDKVDDDRKLKVVSKKEVKKVLGRSPDYKDCFKMRMVFELKPKRKKSKMRGGSY